MAWQQVTLPVADDAAAQLETILTDAGAVAITFTDAADQPILEPLPGEAPLWREARITALLPDSIPIERIGLALVDALGELPTMQVELLPEREWERAWLDAFGPMQFAPDLWVAPHDAEVPAPAAAVIVRLDPGLAFGTGTHATTALCLRRLAALDLAGCRALDFGCGSGILAIAMALCGAGQVDALDIDPQAVTATSDNARANGVSGKVQARLSPTHGPFVERDTRVTVANILAGPLIELAPRLIATLAPGATLLMSGVLDSQAEAVCAAYRPHIEFARPARQDGWVLLEGIRRHAG